MKKMKMLIQKCCVCIVLITMLASNVIQTNGSIKVYAANSATSIEYWTEVCEFETGYNLNGGKVATIRFGLNTTAPDNVSEESREWAICGVEDGNLVLLSTTSFANELYGSTSKYSTSDFVGKIDDTYLGTNYFSELELEKMLTVMVSTLEYDQEENETPIEITKKLYLPDVKDRNTYGTSVTTIYVGTENSIEIALENVIADNGFSLPSSYQYFWLRSPYKTYSLMALGAILGKYVDGINENNAASVLPTLLLNLASVLFASAAKAATSSDSIANSEMEKYTYTLRYVSTGNETAIINSQGTNVTVDNATGKYLMVQNSSGVYALEITSDSKVVNASDVKIGTTILTDFNNCKVWIESTDADRITTAKLATVDSTPVWIPTTDDTYRLSFVSGMPVQMTTTQVSYEYNLVNDLQGPLCFDVFHAYRGVYEIGATYTSYANGMKVYVLSEPITVTLQIPVGLQKENRSYEMICVHQDGNAVVLKDLDTNPSTITFTTDKGYAFALCYKMSNNSL